MHRRFRLLAVVVATAVSLQAQAPNRLDMLVKTLGRIENPAAQASILKGMRESLQGQRGIPTPAGWEELYAKLKESRNADVKSHAEALSVIFGGGAAMDEMRSRLADANAPLEQRRQALDALVAQRDAGALPSLLELATKPGALREPALRGLAGYDDPRIATTLVEAYAGLDSNERRAAIQTLLSRASGAKAFTAAIDAGKIPKTELNAPLARQLQGIKEAEIDAWLKKNWGSVNAPSADKQKEIAKYKEFLHPDLILRADASHGRALFAQACAVCHNMFGTGGHIGPELTGGYEDVDYLLNNILDPNAIIGKDYQQTFVKTKDGQTIAGIVVQDNERAIGLKTLGGEVITLQKGDVTSTELSPQSMMPEGLLSAMHEPDVRDLFLYLRQKQQVPMLITAINANDFFNATDLSNWTLSSPEAWKVESGTMVGRGGPKPVSLTSRMVAGSYKLTAQVQVTGASAAAEVVLTGQQDATAFHGTTLSFGGPSAVNLWEYRAGTDPKMSAGRRALTAGKWHTLEVSRKDEKLTVKLDGEVEFETGDPRYRRHVSPAFWLKGDGGELRMKGLKIEVP